MLYNIFDFSSHVAILITRRNSHFLAASIIGFFFLPIAEIWISICYFSATRHNIQGPRTSAYCRIVWSVINRTDFVIFKFDVTRQRKRWLNWVKSVIIWPQILSSSLCRLIAPELPKFALNWCVYAVDGVARCDNPPTFILEPIPVAPLYANPTVE